MTGLIIIVLGLWIAFSGFILLVICMNSSRFSRSQGSIRRYPRKVVVPKKQALSDLQSSNSPVNAE